MWDLARKRRKNRGFFIKDSLVKSWFLGYNDLMNTVSQASGSRKITDINRSFEERDAQQKAQQFKLPYIDIEGFPVNHDALSLIDKDVAESAQALVFDRVQKVYKLAVVDPEHPQVQDIVKSLTKNDFSVSLFVCSPSGFREVFEAYAVEFLNKKHLLLREDVEEVRNEEKTFASADFKAKEDEISKLASPQGFREIVLAGLQYKASDIHFQPANNGLDIRFRVDGILHQIFHFSEEVAKGLIIRAKYESGMKANITDIPQDGHASVRANGREIDLRVSSLPTPYLESVVIRILDPTKGIRTFAELGFPVELREAFDKILDKKTGMILVTGPTGSGKTTTLYAMLSQLNHPDRKVMTLEDPIEYRLPGLTQSEVNEAKDFNFEAGLKALVRQDPDVILVGEIRSLQTAKLAVEASLTGHVVLSSVHTNSAIGVIDRLRNLGIANFNIAPGLNAIVAQRLVRRVCPHCSKKIAIPKDLRVQNAIDHLESSIETYTAPDFILSPQGCVQCAGVGYSGQMVIAEIIKVDDKLKKLILDDASSLVLEKYLHEETDFLSMFEDGVRKALQGETSLEEVYRVIG